MVNFENGTLVKGAYVVIDGKEYEVHMPEYSGKTATSAENLNKMQKDLQDQLDEATRTLDIVWENDITAGADFENKIIINTIEKSCSLYFGVNTSSAKATAFKIGQFDNTYAPSKTVFGNAVIATDSATTSCQCSIGTDGSININNVGQSSTIFRGKIDWFYE